MYRASVGRPSAARGLGPGGLGLPSFQGPATRESGKGRCAAAVFVRPSGAASFARVSRGSAVGLRPPSRASVRLPSRFAPAGPSAALSRPRPYGRKPAALDPRSLAVKLGAKVLGPCSARGAAPSRAACGLCRSPSLSCARPAAVLAARPPRSSRAACRSCERWEGYAMARLGAPAPPGSRNGSPYIITPSPLAPLGQGRWLSRVRYPPPRPTPLGRKCLCRHV